MRYKGSCLICREKFGFTKEDIKIDCEINNHAIELKAYVTCPICGLKLTITRVEVHTIPLEEYPDKDWRN